jgi:ABC-type branched-subunit amino acid transport system permease subunit
MPIALIIVALVLAVLVPILIPWLNFVFTLAIAKGFAALGVALLLRAGMISIGHALYFAVGAYVTAYLTRQLGVSDLAVILVTALVMSALSGLLIGMFMVRYRGIFFAMLNLAISMVVFPLLAKLYHLTGGTDGVRVAMPTLFGFSPDRAVFEGILLYVALGLVVMVGYLVHCYLRSPMGKALEAVHTNEVRLEYLGVSAWGVLLSAYTVSAGLAGLGGAIGAVALGHVLPEFAYWTQSGHLVLIAVLGGIGGVAGPFIGALFLEVVRSFAVGYVGDAWHMIVGGTLLLVIFFLPSGLYGLVNRFLKRGGAS